MKDFKYSYANEPIRVSKRFLAAAESVFGPQNDGPKSTPKPATPNAKVRAPR